MFAVLHGMLGMAAIVGVAVVFSENRKAVRWKTVAAAIGLQAVLAVVLLKFPGSRQVFFLLNALVETLAEATEAGTTFVFGYLGGGTPPPFEVVPGASTYILALRGLPIVLVASALSSLLFYWRLLPKVVGGFSWLLQRSIGVGGAEGLAAAANVFLGMVEAPLFIRPYLARLSRGELFCLMTCGMATIAGTVMVLYAGILKPVIPDAMGHLLVASIISAPAAIALARIMVPTPAGEATGAGAAAVSEAGSAMEAITSGTLQGLTLLLNIVAMLIVLVALVELVNIGLGWLPEVGQQPLTLQRLFGWGLAPVVWAIGIPWSESIAAGSLMGTKTILNEFLAYLQMGSFPAETLSGRSKMIMTYAMCGFANPGSLGIMIGGLGAMAPDRRREIVSLGFKSILAGTLATAMTGALVGMLW
ncbi:MAG: nucleoside:proton symporter [Desulfobacterales bacterium]|nr:nucleoside:proton symporter [Desulfobacterales bacterium]MCF8081399.1 nucleoside:proton symporter [Desulfobacterales bacterium]